MKRGTDRNFVKKAVNRALPQIGKRNGALRAAAIETAEKILQQDGMPARLVASNAIGALAKKNAAG